MGKTLVIAEKPSVGADYARTLGGEFKKSEGFLESDTYVVSWAVGHLVGLAEPEDYDKNLTRWSIKSLPILPDSFQLRPDAKGAAQLTVLKKLMKRRDVDEIVNGCDAGREGELIFAYIYEWAEANKPVRRLWVSSMTRDAIRQGFEHLRTGDELTHLAEAARSRSEADWLVGMNATRAATVRGRALGGVVSLGRVQTPTLALIVNRDAQIDAFKPVTYFLVEARFSLHGSGVRRYTGRWFEGNVERLDDRQRADRVVAAANGAACQVESLNRTERRERAPLLYDLTSLQREANSRFGLTATRTLAAAQRLYEGSTAGALLTYPRTRARFLPSDQIPQLKRIASQLSADARYHTPAAYVAHLEQLPLGRVIDNDRIEDHHAIIPTGELATRPLSGDDQRVYDLVVRRFLAVFHPDAVWEDTEIITVAGNERFRTRGRRLEQAGWRAAYDEAPSDGADAEPAAPSEAEETDQLVPRVEEGERGLCEEAIAPERQTRPPAHYSEASLLSAMESAGKLIEDEEVREAMKDSGLGTPATRAETIEKLIRVLYVERIGRSLRATAKGRMAIGVLGDSPLASAELTGQWEQRLNSIEHGQEQRADFMNDIRQFTGDLVDYFRGITAEDVRAQWAVLGACPNGDGQIRENRSAYGCTSWTSKEQPGCGFVIWKTIEGRSTSPSEARVLIETGETPLLDGFRTRPSRGRLVMASGQVQLVGEDGARLDVPAADREVIARCPKCGGDVKENKRAFGCSSWKSSTSTGCGFVIWNSVSGHQVTVGEARQLIDDGHTGALEFKVRKSTYGGRLVLKEDFTVVVERSDGKEQPAPASRRRAVEQTAKPSQPVSEARVNGRQPAPGPLAAGAVVKRTALPAGDDLREILASQSVEVIDRRESGGSLWVIGGPELKELMDCLEARMFRFTFSQEGGRATKHRPAWWIRDNSGIHQPGGVLRK